MRMTHPRRLGLRFWLRVSCSRWRAWGYSLFAASIVRVSCRCRVPAWACCCSRSARLVGPWRRTKRKLLRRRMVSVASAPTASASPLASDELGRALGRFREHLASERRASPHTVSAYLRDLESLASYVRARNSGTANLSLLDKFMLRAWLGEVAKTVAPPTIARKISSVRALCEYLLRTGELRQNPSATLASPKSRRKLPRFLAPEAAAEVMTAPLARESGREVCHLRDALALELLYGSGLRVSELATLDLSQLSSSEAEVRVLGKGRKERIVPLGSKSLAALEAYLPRRSELAHPRTGACDPHALLLGQLGKRLSVRWLQ